MLPLPSRAIFFSRAHSDLLSRFFLSNLPRRTSSRSAQKPGIELFLILAATASYGRRSHKYAIEMSVCVSDGNEKVPNFTRF